MYNPHVVCDIQTCTLMVAPYGGQSRHKNVIKHKLPDNV